MTHEVWLAEPSKLFREGLKALLRTSAFEVTREASDIAGLVGFDASTSGPAIMIIVVEAKAETLDRDLSAIRLACERFRAPVVLLVDTLSLKHLTAFMGAGASAYLLRDLSAGSLKQSMELILAGEKVLPTEFVSVLLNTAAIGNSSESVTESGLSKEQALVLTALSRGYSNRQIANEFKLPEPTVKLRIKQIFTKIEARNRTEAAIWARNHGW